MYTDVIVMSVSFHDLLYPKKRTGQRVVYYNCYILYIHVKKYYTGPQHVFGYGFRIIVRQRILGQQFSLFCFLSG